MKKILLIAGEISGDMHASFLAEQLFSVALKKGEDLEIFGVGGNRMEQSGIQMIENIVSRAVIGFLETLKNIIPFYQLMNKIKEFVIDKKIDMVIFVDFSGFNLRLAKKIHDTNARLIYYFCPQIWASREKRAEGIAKWIHRVIAVFPFEVDLYKKYNANLSYFGHPLMDIVRSELSREEFRLKYNISPDEILIGILPGSRKGEIERLLPVMAETARKLTFGSKKYRFICGIAEGANRQWIKECFEKKGMDVFLLEKETYNLISSSEIVWVASGTATLETAILNTPMIILYKTSWLTGYIARKLITVKNIGLANIVAGKRIVPELIQEDAEPLKLFEETRSILDSAERVQEIKRELKTATEKLGKPGVIENVAIELLGDLA